LKSLHLILWLTLVSLNVFSKGKVVTSPQNDVLIVFNQRIEDKCLNYSIKCKYDSVLIEEREDDKLINSNLVSYQTEPFSQIKSLRGKNDSLFSYLSKFSLNTHRFTGIDFMIEIKSNQKSRRYYIADIDPTKLKTQEMRMLMSQLKMVYNYIDQKNIAKVKASNKLNNF